jgi:protein-S-isoprenylcysteine O-methyltransferase Ste14
MQSLELRIPPPVVALLIAVVMWGILAQPPSLPLTVEFRQILILILVIVGMTFDLLGLLAFRRSRTTINPLKPVDTSVLVTSGVYRITRNPMYLGLVLLLTAWACYLSMLLPLVGPVLFMLYVKRFQIVPEERIMHSKFGEEYAAYTNQVRRWL